jgi:aminoglycoside phosphotransferase (APT) family kinase protein
MSLPTTTQKLEQVVQKVAPHSKLRRSWPLSGGISAEMTALELEHPDGHSQKMIVRRPSEQTLQRNPQAAADEFKLLQLTRSLDLATQTPYLLDQTGQIFPRPYLVIEYIEGKPEFAPPNLADFSRQLATHLARIHQVDGSLPALSFLAQPVRGFVETFGRPPAALNTALDEGRIRQTLAAAWPLPQRNPSVLLHGDFWPGNLLWQAGRLAAIIDWEDARLGDPLTDFATSRLEIAWIFGPEAMATFSRHYQALLDLDYTNLPYWDLYAALRLARMAGANLAEWAAFFPPFGRPDITEQTIRDDCRVFISQAYEKL